MHSKILILAILLFVANSACGFEDVVGKIKSGFQLAGKILGLDEAGSVAKLVTEAFGKSVRRSDKDGGNTIFSGFFRILGLNTKKISAIAVNAIIFMAQLISTSLSKPPPSELTAARDLKGSPLDWIMNNTQISYLLAHAKDESLPEHIVEYIKERSLDEETDCVQLLICKSAPIVRGMQKAVGDSGTSKGRAGLYAHLPSMGEIADHGDECERKHRYCSIHY